MSKKKSNADEILKARAQDCAKRQGTWKGSYCLNAKVPAKGRDGLKIKF